MRFVLLLVAAVIAVVAGIAALQMSGKNAAPTGQATLASSSQAPSVSTVEVLVARAPIPVGSVIDESMVDKQPWPENLVLDGFIVSGSKDGNIVGKVARSSFQAREPFMADKLANPNDPSFLAAALPAGMRAVTIATDAVSGVAGYVFPGDRIDVLMTHNVLQDIKANESDNPSMHMAQKPAITEVLVPNARVLAVNLREVATKTSSAPSATPSSVTLEVNEEQMQKLRLAEKVGTLSLALRSLKDRDNSDTPEPTVLEGLSRERAAQMQRGETINIIRGVGKSNDSGAGQSANALGMAQPAGGAAIREQ